MNKGLIALYRISGIFVSLYAYMILFVCLVTLFSAAQGPFLIFTFIAACLVIYSVLSTMFGRMVLTMQQPIRAALKDWIKINAYISLAAYVCVFLGSLQIVTNPSVIETAIKQHPEMLRAYGTTINTTQLLTLFRCALFLSFLVTAHCFWTLRLVRKFREFFK